MNNQDILSSLGFSKGIRYGLKRKWQWIKELSLATVVGNDDYGAKIHTHRNRPILTNIDRLWLRSSILRLLRRPDQSGYPRNHGYPWIDDPLFPLSIVPRNWPCFTPYSLKVHLPMARFPGSNRTNIGHIHHFHECPVPIKVKKASPLHVLPSDMLDTARYSRPWLCLVTMYTGSLPSFPKR